MRGDLIESVFLPVHCQKHMNNLLVFIAQSNVYAARGILSARMVVCVRSVPFKLSTKLSQSYNEKSPVPERAPTPHLLTNKPSTGHGQQLVTQYQLTITHKHHSQVRQSAQSAAALR
jgi:hypothetical protein